MKVGYKETSHYKQIIFIFLFFLIPKFFIQPLKTLMSSVSNDGVLYHQIKTLINFLCRRKLNPISFIQLLETLSFELTEIHENNFTFL